MRFVLLVTMLLAVSASAAKPRVVVDAPPAMAKIITKLLAKKYTPTVATAPLSDEPTAKEAANATRDLNAIAIVQARRDATTWVVRVINGADGTPLATSTFKNAKKLAPPKNFGPTLLTGLKSAQSPAAVVERAPPPPVAEVTPAPAPTAKPKPTPEVKPDDAPAPAPSKPDLFDDSQPAPVASAERPMALRFGIGFTGLTRDYNYRDDIFKDISKYNLPFGPAPSASLELYPGAFFTSGIGAHFGIAGSFNYLVGLSSKIKDSTDGVKYPTTSMQLRASLVGRIPLGLLDLQIGVGYSLQTFSIAPASAAARPNIPDVSFGGIRPSLGATLHLTKIFHLHFGGGYSVLLSKGEFGSSTYFPRSTGGGVDTWVGVSVRPVSHFEIRLQGDYSRYFFSMNPEVGDPYIAGGALDQYLSGTISANVVF